MKPSKITTDAQQRRKKIIVARLRGGDLATCAAVSGTAKSYCSRVVNAYIEKVEAGITEEFDEDVDPVLRWQIARAEKHEIEVQQLKKELMPVSIIQDQCRRIAKHLRSAQKQLDKTWSVEAGNIVRDALKAAEREEQQIAGK